MVMLVNCGGDGGSEVSGESAGGREPWWRNNDRKRKNWGGDFLSNVASNFSSLRR